MTKSSTLSSICSFRKEPVSVEEIQTESYITTESMLPNKGGLKKASLMPSKGTISRYCSGDTLISNIRPYFKKIWHANCNGGCSNDVLVIMPKSCLSEYLYWILSDDKFFEYTTATAKGTKMPRGDRIAIMNYPVPDNDIVRQRAIVSALSPIRKKIQLNDRINDYLAA